MATARESLGLRRPVVKALVVCLAALLASWAYASAVDAQEGTTTVAGFVTNGTAGAGTPQDVQVVLQVFRAGGQVEAWDTTADASGRFAFEGVPVQGVASYSVAAIYLGIGYTVDLEPTEDLANVRLTVYESTSSLDNVSLASNTIIVLGAKPSIRTIAIMEIAQVVNKGDRVFVPDLAQGGGMSLLTFPLPQGATDLDVQSELPEGQALQVDAGFAMTAPVPPSQEGYGVAFTYSLPYEGAALDLTRSFVRGVGTFRVLVAEEVGAVSSAAMTDRGSATIGGKAFRLHEARDIAPVGVVNVALAGLPQPSLGEKVLNALSVRWWQAAAIPLAMALGLMALLAMGLRRRPFAVAPIDVVRQDRAALLQAIASLDDRFERGELGMAEYQEQRQVLKAHLLRLVWQEVAPA